MCPPRAVFATGTSAIPVERLAARTGRPGFHRYPARGAFVRVWARPTGRAGTRC
ncbi:hypothetical protein ACIG3E_34130 [Streptomyces sp. NPDC053474]|uniref:hypothetical protein n=1 Tax=Streptomyces sp. NPDC053474 TaxID=3365704 RepID=UPI0037CCF1FC